MCDDDEQVYSRCHECGERKRDPEDFYDGLRCHDCCEACEECGGTRKHPEVITSGDGAGSGIEADLCESAFHD